MNLQDIRIPVRFCFLWILLSEVQVATTSASGLLKLDVTGVGNSEIYNNNFPLEKSLDNDPSTFYHAKSEVDGWAKYSFPESTVRLVRLQNRDSCCADRMINNVVYVCTSEADDTCQECGKVTDSIGLSQWASITCTGLRGQFVKVQATNSYLQIAQIEVYADPKLTVDDLTKQSVSEDSSSTSLDSSRFALEKSLDENPSTMFHAQSTTDGWAKYTIPESKVRIVRLQNRQDCCADRMTNNVVYVCADNTDASCQECGRVFEDIGLSEWVEITCGGGMTGTCVKVAATDSYLQIAQIEVYVDTEALTQWKRLDIRSATSSRAVLRKADWAVDKSWDNNPNTHFIAWSGSVGRANYKVDKSDVSKVRLQNRLSSDPTAVQRNGMTNNLVYVCTTDSDYSCQKCGQVTESIGPGQWAEITCSKALTGSIVKIQALGSQLQIAEIEIFAYRAVTKNVIKMDVTMSGYSNELDENKYSIAKSLDNDPSTFFHAESPTDGWAEYEIRQSNVRYVQLQNRQDCCADRMTNNVVTVCFNHYSDTCTQCGKVTESIGQGQWAKVTCTDEGIYGSVIKVQATNSFLQIAEIEVYSDEEPTRNT